MTPPSASSPSPASPALKRVGRFRIVRELGRGSIGTVYLAHDPIIDRSVAIKTLNTRLPHGDKKKYEQQFINEARAAGRLSHAHIVTIFDALIEDGITYIAMEHLQGSELHRLLDQGHSFTTDEIAVITLKIAEALNYAHKSGVVHRDIKPANIFLLDDNHPKIMDFGIARAPNRVSELESDEAYTLFKNNLLGTPNYMSPEQALGRPVDHRTDIYSLGVILYEMLTGTKPFKSRDTNHLLQQIAFKIPTAPHQVDPIISPILSNIAMKAMSKRPEKRYQNGHEMALDIRRYLALSKRGRSESKKKEVEAEAKAENSKPAVKKPVSRTAVKKRSKSKLLWLALLAAIGTLAANASRPWF
jgi:serine/threonine-protein kinase